MLADVQFRQFPSPFESARGPPAFVGGAAGFWGWGSFSLGGALVSGRRLSPAVVAALRVRLREPRRRAAPPAASWARPVVVRVSVVAGRRRLVCRLDGRVFLGLRGLDWLWPVLWAVVAVALLLLWLHW